MFVNRRSALVLVVSLFALYPAPALDAQSSAPTPTRGQQEVAGACDFSDVPGVVWWGTDGRMTLEQLAAYVAPVYWFSPDEPLLERKKGADIRLPETFPFETAPDAPVVYYQFDEINRRGDTEGPAYTPDETNKHNSVVDLSAIGVMQLSFFAYFSSEEGLGAHQHDVEAAEFKVVVFWSTGEWLREHSAARCDEKNYVVGVTRVTAKAHGLTWYYNVSDTDKDSRFPMYLLVEEGKHGLATDKNSDGYFTPGYDVSRHINDAWGVRDNMRTGRLASGGYQGWMTKVRRPEYRSFPPLPEDSPLYAEFEERAGPVTERAVYELRPLPPAELAGDDKDLYHFIEDKEVPDWPELGEVSDLEEFIGWVEEGGAVKSFAIALRTDGDLGFSFVFPLLIVKNFEDPLSGGFIVWRMYLKDKGLRDFGWMLMYTPSASRWIDTYLAAGVEWDDEVVDGVKQTDTDFVFETGLKFRVNMSHSPLKFLTLLTDFWGFRAGILNKGFTDIDQLTYVLEIGAGAW